MQRAMAFAALVMLALPVSGSLVEENSGHAVTYQFDGGTDADAPDTCEGLATATHDFVIPRGNATRGFLVPPDDNLDHFRVPVAASEVGLRVTIHVAEQDAALPVAIDVVTPGCGTSVAAAENQPSPPVTAPAPGPGESQVHAHNLQGNWTCDGTRWFFVINQLGSLPAPASIHVVWTNGEQEEVALVQATPATVAHYATTHNLGYTVKDATANLPSSWSGRFNLGAGPCNAVDGHAVFGPPNTVRAHDASFTVATAGDYVLVVRMGNPPPPPTSIAVTCHTACSSVPGDATKSVSYRADSFVA